MPNTEVSLERQVKDTLPVENGGTGVASLTPYAVIAGGTTATGDVQQVSGVGTAGQALTSNGASALPTWQNVPATTPGGATTNVQYNNAGVFGGNSGFNYNGAQVGVGMTPVATTPFAIAGDPAVTHRPALTLFNGATAAISFQANNTVFGPLIQFSTGSGGFDFFGFRALVARNVISGFALTTSNATTTGALDRLLISGGATVANVTVVSSNLLITGGRTQTAKGADVTAANDLTLGNGNMFTITGNTQINAITTTNWQAGSEITLIFTGTPTVKHNTAGGAGTAPMLLSAGVDFVASNPSVLKLGFDGTNWQEISRSVNHV